MVKKFFARNWYQLNFTSDLNSIAVETKLRTLNSSGKLRVSEALNSSYVAIESLNKYRQALRVAIDETKNEENKELQWRQVTDLFDMQTADVNEANQKFQIAK
jgi:hypothetical protein